MRQAGWHRRSILYPVPADSIWDRIFFCPQTKKGACTMSEEKIPYKIYLDEKEMPKAWYNLRADMKNKPAPLLNPATHNPMKAEELAGVFCDELIKQELDNDTPYFEIPEEIRNFYKMYQMCIRDRPSAALPTVCFICLPLPMSAG